MRPFKIRCSAIGSIMAYPEKNEITKGAMTYIHQWLKEQLYSRSKEFTSMQTQKGIYCEADSIEFAADHYGWGMVSKNEKMYEDEFMTGTPDLVLSELIPDIKNSFSCFSFPLFDTKLDSDYEWQIQGYMNLTGKDHGAIIYTLMDAPDELVENEARKRMYALGMTELDMELYDTVKAEMTYSHLPDNLRIKRFDVSRDNKKIQQVKDRVRLIGEYVSSLDLSQYNKTKLKAA